MAWAKLEISDGTTTVNLIALGTGFHLVDWNPQVIQLKEGGVFQDSPIAPGRRLVFVMDATAIEPFDLDINDYDQNSLIAQAQDLMRLLNKARAYQSTEFQDEPVWIRARAECETNDRYALIINWAIPNLDNPYGPPFFVANEIAAMEDINLQLERGHWLANQPGQGECVQVENQQVWNYRDVWEVNTTQPTGNVTSLLQTANGYLYAGDNGQIDRSIDNGASWGVNTTSPTSAVLALLQTANGYIYAGETNQIWRSINDGGSWVSNFSTGVVVVEALIQLTNGNILAGGQNTSFRTAIWRSTDNGSSWTMVLDSVFGGQDILSLYQHSNGDAFAGAANGVLFKSTDNGATWTYLIKLPTGSAVTAIIRGSDGYIYAGCGRDLYWSLDSGATWQKKSSPGDNSSHVVRALFQASSGAIYIRLDDGAGNVDIVKSLDLGYSFKKDTSLASTMTANTDFIQAADGKIYVGDPGNILRTVASPTITLGYPLTCLDEIYIANKQNYANITHIKILDGGVYTNIFPISSFPQNLWPGAATNGEFVYFGIEAANIDAGPFGNLIFDIGSICDPGNLPGYQLQYSPAWGTLTIHDATNDGSFNFTKVGINGIFWSMPADWTPTTIDGVNAWWIRLSFNFPGNATTSPTQVNRDIYTVVNSYVDIDDTLVKGDIPAIMQVKLNNRSDPDGPGGSGPSLWTNRLLVGLRGLDRGSNFQAYLNISDVQNPPGILVSLGTNTTFATDGSSPTGRRATYNPGGVEAMATRATISLNPSIARHFYGTFHAFLRAQRTAGVATDLSIRLQVATGSGGITFTTQSKQLQATTAFEVLDFGEIALPVSGAFKSSDLADTTEIRVQASAASGTPDLYLYDLILIPVDEWSIDAVDFANESDSDVGRSGSVSKFLDIDSVTDLRIDIKTLVRTADANKFITAEYNPITSGPAILQANADQRLWFFAMRTSATGASYNWLAPPEIAHTVQILKNDRYLGLRGAR